MPTRILIIEDNPTNLDLMTYLLAAFGHTPLTAQDGEEGLEVARREVPDLIICDVQLPIMDGYEVAHWLKSHPQLHVIPLVAVTALAMVGDRDKMLTAGFDGYIAKPISPETFVGEVEKFLPGERESTSIPSSSSTVQPVLPQTKVATLLVVDNLPVNIDLARSTFEPFGYEVIAARGMEEALALARKSSPDLILSDVNMADGSGYDLIQAVKADAQLSTVPFLFITSTALGLNDQVKGLSLGAMRFLTRPIEPQVLLAEINACLQQKQRGEPGGNHFGGR
jgi:two-component system cell cycle response regulator